MHRKYRFLLAPLLLLIMATSCKKDHFQDTGVHIATYNGTVLQYLQSKPEYFDTLVKIIDYAGMTNVFRNEEITFFAPADSSIRNTIKLVNTELDRLGRPRITRYQQIKDTVWRLALSRYLFKGKRSLTDFPQVDFQNISAYPGQIYSSYYGEIMNVGVVHNSGGGVPYEGYRQLILSYIPSPSSARDYLTWRRATVASVNVQPSNGYVHVLRYVDHQFGFDAVKFLETALAAGISN